MSQYCPECGAYNEIGADVCRYCGASLKAADVNMSKVHQTVDFDEMPVPEYGPVVKPYFGETEDNEETQFVPNYGGAPDNEETQYVPNYGGAPDNEETQFSMDYNVGSGNMGDGYAQNSSPNQENVSLEPYVQQNAGGYGQNPYMQQNQGGYGQNPYMQQNAGGYGQNPYMQQNAGDYGQDPYMQQNAGNYGQPPYMQYGTPYGSLVDPSWPVRDKMTAGLFGIFLGGLGIHKFYMGKIGLGVVYLLFSWTGIPEIIGFVEGILYLCASDEEFQMKNHVRLR